MKAGNNQDFGMSMTDAEIYALGRMYEFGITVEQDHRKAAELYIEAAEMGNEQAKNVFFFDFDQKPRINTKQERVATIMEAAQMGYVDAQYSLGGRYRGGIGMRKSYPAAFYWLSKAAEQGHVEATYYLGAMYLRGRGTEVDIGKAKELTRKAADLGYAPAQHEIGKVLLGEEGRKLEAIEWIRRSSDNGYRIAQFDLGTMHLQGDGVEFDPIRGMELLTSSAKQRYASAAYKLGEIFDKGQYGFEKDPEKAIRWYKKAQRIGYVGAELRLAQIYQNGEGVERDLFQCIKYYKLADQHGWHYANNMLMEIFAN
ncbi:hypothetical protein [Methanomethylophilus alvi]|uniref:hypothetical protein n=1 Tax=Methanomethylophilus alvi TaxID=1291540 RepID=UPI0037DCF8EB